MSWLPDAANKNRGAQLVTSEAFPGAPEVKNPPANAGDLRDVGLIPESGRFPGGGNDNPLCSILAWRIPRTEEPGGLQSMGPQRVHTRAHTHTHTELHLNFR